MPGPPCFPERPARESVKRGALTGARFAFIDGVRGLVAVWIMLFHAFAGGHVVHLETALPHFLDAFVHMAPVGIVVFFVISGFVIAYALGSRRLDLREAGRFLARRFLRLGPPYWLSLVITGIAAYVLTGVHPTLLGVAAHVFYLQELLHVRPLSGIYWTLSLEMQFYIVFCLLIVAADHRHGGRGDWWSRRIVFAGAGIAAAAVVLGVVRHPDEHAVFLGLWYSFLIGVFAWWVLDGVMSQWWFAAYTVVLLVGARRTGDDRVLTAVVTGAVLLGAGGIGRLGRWLSGRVPQFLGKISYSLYLIHNPVAAICLAFTLYRLTPQTVGWELLWLIVLVMVSCLAALVFQRLIERPSIRLSRRLRMPAAETTACAGVDTFDAHARDYGTGS